MRKRVTPDFQSFQSLYPVFLPKYKAFPRLIGIPHPTPRHFGLQPQYLGNGRWQKEAGGFASTFETS
jgi:hypothetical protein